MNGNDGVPGAKTFLITTDFCKLFYFSTVLIRTAEFLNPIGYLWRRIRSLIQLDSSRGMPVNKLNEFRHNMVKVVCGSTRLSPRGSTLL